MIKRIFAISAIIISAQTSARAFQAVAVQSFDPSCNCSNPFYQGTVGYDFQVNAFQAINRLGIYDSTGDGLDYAKQVGLWDRDSGQLLASAVVPAGTSSTLLGQFRYVPVAEVTLDPTKTYTIGAFYDQFGPDFYELFTSNNVFSPWFNYLNPAERFGIFAQPFNLGQSPFGIYGPNLGYEVPGPLPIAGAAAAFSASRKIRRRIHMKASSKA